VHVGGWLEDTSLVDKYKMSDEEYNKRENTYRKWKEGKLKVREQPAVVDVSHDCTLVPVVPDLWGNGAPWANSIGQLPD
jgi:hypothetical protein